MLLRQQLLASAAVSSTRQQPSLVRGGVPGRRRTVPVVAGDSFKNFFDKLKGGGKGGGEQDAARKAIQVSSFAPWKQPPSAAFAISVSCKHTHTHTHTHVCTRTHTHLRTYTHKHTITHVYTRAHTRTHIHTLTITFTHV